MRTGSSMPVFVVASRSVSYQSTDFYALEELLEPEEIEIRDRVRAFCEREVTPRINDYWERAEFPFELVPKIGPYVFILGVLVGVSSALYAYLVEYPWTFQWTESYLLDLGGTSDWIATRA